MEQAGSKLVWDAVTLICDQTNALPVARVLRESDFVEHAITFANTGSEKSAMALCGGMNADAPAAAKSARNLKVPNDKQRRAEEQALFRRHLATVMQGCLPREVKVYLALSAGRVLLVPIPELIDEGSRLGYRYLPQSLRAALSFALLLLIDQSRSYAARICQCKLRTCGNFFFVKRAETGRPRRRYCNDDHMSEAHDLGAAERVKRRRAERAATATRAAKGRKR
jgi:hypothetical protein